MIIDKLENISKYNIKLTTHNNHLLLDADDSELMSRTTNDGEAMGLISEKIIDFLRNLTSESATGRYEISDGIYANIDEYEPKNYENCKFEAHKKYIDIQMVLEGEENLECRCTDGLRVMQEYDETNDIMFFESTEEKSDFIHLIPYKFAFIYPHEAHKTQIKTVSDKVKKVVVKVKMIN